MVGVRIFFLGGAGVSDTRCKFTRIKIICRLNLQSHNICRVRYDTARGAGSKGVGGSGEKESGSFLA